MEQIYRLIYYNMSQDFILQYANAHPHIHRGVQDFFNTHNIGVEWSIRRSDLNAIEYVWAAIEVMSTTAELLVY